MANKGYALYQKEGKLYLFTVKYEYIESRFVGFDDFGETFLIRKLNDEQKQWKATHDVKKDEKLKNLIFIGDYYLTRILYKDFPKGKPYTQLPGGGGVYKETRKYNNIYELFKNETFLRALEKYSTFKEGYNIVRDLIREAIGSLIFTRKINKPEVTAFEMFEDNLKQEKPAVGFTAVSIENEDEKKKISNIFDSLKEQGKIPDNFIRPAFKDGTLDYHMTIKLGELPLSHRKDLDKEVTLNIGTIGISDKAIALGVSGEYFSDNDFQHITLAFYELPQYSKEITDWQPLDHLFNVKGIIREFTTDKKVIKRGVFDEANQIQIGNFPDQVVPAGNARIFPQAAEN